MKQANYGDLPGEFARKGRVVILPVPYDGTSTWMKGADKGPEAMIAASGNMELYDIETDSEVYKLGIVTDKPVLEKASPDAMVAAVKKRVAGHLEKEKFVVLVGGEHSVSVGAIQAHAEKFRGMSVLQFDAHSDCRSDYHGSKYNHACVMARVKEMGCPMVQVGIRSMDVSEKPYLGKIFWAHDIIGKGDGWMDDVVRCLTEKVYVTIDVDGFDPSIMPSTGTPEPGGLLWWDVCRVLRKVAEKKTIVGADVTELCPSDSNKAPDFLVAKLIYKILSYRFYKDPTLKKL